MELSIKNTEEELNSLGNWATAKDLFPTIEVNQKTGEISVTYFSISNSKRGQWGCTHEYREVISPNKDAVLITGLTGLRNDRRHTGGRQKFCYGVFIGDSGHIYTHRAIASKGWLNCPPENLLKRLRKLGIGADKGVIQQGDFLLKPANSKALPDSYFEHETMGAGHHTFICPVLYSDMGKSRQYKITEPTLLIHKAIDGIKHPDVVVPIGVYIVGTTSNGLSHSNRRD